jgi:uncharacterized protein
MTRIFADTYFFLALLNAQDLAHTQAVGFSSKIKTVLVTTEAVLFEVADGMARPSQRNGIRKFFDFLVSSSRFEIVPNSPALFQSALQLYDHHSDKAWSLTDCTSFHIMRSRGITTALTADHHFEQAGFVALMK